MSRQETIKSRSTVLLLGLFALLLQFLSLSCSPLKSSSYSRYNKFSYDSIQPRFHFYNSFLGIQGKWYWASSSREIPDISYLPTYVKKALKPFVKKHGKILFATWISNYKKFSQPGFVNVTKEDVRKVSKYAYPAFEFVLVNDKLYFTDSSAYVFIEKNEKFKFFFNSPKAINDSLMTMEVIAQEPTRYYNFLCILNKSYFGPDEATTRLQSDRFIGDVVNYLEKK